MKPSNVQIAALKLLHREDGFRNIQSVYANTGATRDDMEALVNAGLCCKLSDGVTTLDTYLITPDGIDALVRARRGL